MVNLFAEFLSSNTVLPRIIASAITNFEGNFNAGDDLIVFVNLKDSFSNIFSIIPLFKTSERARVLQSLLQVLHTQILIALFRLEISTSF